MDLFFYMIFDFSFLMALTATGKYAYQREGGVYIVPIGCLKA